MECSSKRPMDSRWNELPDQAMATIAAARGLSTDDIAHMALVCKRWAGALRTEGTVSLTWGEFTAPPSSEKSSAPSLPSPLMKRSSKGPMDSGWGELPACAVVRIAAASGLADKDVNRMVFLCHRWADILLGEVTAASGESTASPSSESSAAATRGGEGEWIQLLRHHSRWSTIPYDLLFAIALRLKDSAVLRLVCKPWRNAFPGPPFLVCSTLAGRTIGWGITSFGSFSPVQVAKNFPPNSVCWGGSLDVVGIVNPDGHHDCRIFCLVCEGEERLPPLLDSPDGLFVFQIRNILMRAVHVVASQLLYHFHERRFVPVNEGLQRFVESVQIKIPRNYTIGPDSVVETNIDGIVIQQPQVAEFAQGSHSSRPKGHHLFMCNEEMYLCIILRGAERDDIAVKLFRTIEVDATTISFVLANSIGPYSVHLGANQPLVCPSDNVSIGRRSNTAYFEDWDDERGSRVLSINFSTRERHIFNYPGEITGTREHWAPAVWVCKDLHRGTSTACRFCYQNRASCRMVDKKN